MTGKENAELLGLIEKHLEGSLPPEETDRLLRLVADDPTVAHLLARETLRAEMLSQVLQHEEARSAADVPRGLDTTAIRAAAAARRRRASSRRRLSRRQRKARAWLRYGVLPLAAAAAFLAAVHFYNLHQIRMVQEGLCAEIIEVRGEVQVIRGGSPAPAKRGSLVRPGDKLRTETDEGVTLKYRKEPTTLEVKAGSDLSLLINASRKDSSKRYRLDHGELQAEVARQKPGAPMRIATPQAEARVIGTRFVLRAAPAAESTRLEVAEGKVRLTRLGEGDSVDVEEGRYAVADAKGLTSGLLVAAVPPATRAGPVALYRFDEGRGMEVRDVSGEGAPLDLRIADSGAVRWTAEGLAVEKPTIITSQGPATKIIKACKASGELTVEAWIVPHAANEARSAMNLPCRIVSVSGDYHHRDFTLGQGQGTNGSADNARHYSARIRAPGADANGRPWISTKGPSVRRDVLTHLVVTRAASGRIGLYVDGKRVDSMTELAKKGDLGKIISAGKGFSSWNDSYRLALANEFGIDRAWLGEYRRVAIYSRALEEEEIQRNFRAGLD